jgi:AraC-like DNA-binding protein
MAFLERAPRGRLRAIVERLWLVEDPTPGAAGDTICPDGAMEIVLHIGDAMRQRLGVDDRLQARALLVGQMDGPIDIVPTGAISMVGARFAPGAFHRVLPIPQHRLARAIHDLTDIAPLWARESVDRLAAAPTAAARLDVFEAALERLVPEASDDAAQAIAFASARLRASGGETSIGTLARAIGISRRQFERRFQEHVGLSPRLFARIVRFQRAFHALDRSSGRPHSGAAIAARCGYADQAHMVREIRRFAGKTPSVLAHADGLTAFFRA